MNISGIGQNYSAQNILTGISLPDRPSQENNINQDRNNLQSRHIDMSNVSVKETNSLIKSGAEELLDVAPFISPHILQGENFDSDNIENIRVDLIGQIEDSIEFSKSINENTDFLENVLEKHMKINGTKFNPIVDIKV